MQALTYLSSAPQNRLTLAVAEYGGFATKAEDLVSSYPSLPVATHFLRNYMKACCERVPTIEHPKGGLLSSVESAGEEDVVSAAFFAELYDAVEKYALASHLFWCVYALRFIVVSL